MLKMWMGQYTHWKAHRRNKNTSKWHYILLTLQRRCQAACSWWTGGGSFWGRDLWGDVGHHDTSQQDPSECPYVNPPWLWCTRHQRLPRDSWREELVMEMNKGCGCGRGKGGACIVCTLFMHMHTCMCVYTLRYLHTIGDKQLAHQTCLNSS